MARRRRNGVIDDFGKLHWFWKFLLITGSFGLANTAVRRVKCYGAPPDPYEPLDPYA